MGNFFVKPPAQDILRNHLLSAPDYIRAKREFETNTKPALITAFRSIGIEPNIVIASYTISHHYFCKQAAENKKFDITIRHFKQIEKPIQRRLISICNEIGATITINKELTFHVNTNKVLELLIKLKEMQSIPNNKQSSREMTTLTQ